MTNNRYDRQILFKGIKKSGQGKISNAVIAIIGVGGLGSISSELLVRAGVKRLIIFDDDKVELSNLQRQGSYTEEDIGEKKVFALRAHLEKIDSSIEIMTIDKRLTESNINLLKSVDIIIDGVDNMKTRLLINKFSKENNVPYIYGAVAGSIGMVYTINLTNNESPCLKCVLGNANKFITSEDVGIINPTTHITSSIQVSEALKIIVGKKSESNIIRFDIWKHSFDIIKVKRNNKCDVCKKIFKKSKR